MWFTFCLVHMNPGVLTFNLEFYVTCGWQETYYSPSNTCRPPRSSSIKSYPGNLRAAWFACIMQYLYAKCLVERVEIHQAKEWLYFLWHNYVPYSPVLCQVFCVCVRAPQVLQTFLPPNTQKCNNDPIIVTHFMKLHFEVLNSKKRLLQASYFHKRENRSGQRDVVQGMKCHFGRLNVTFLLPFTSLYLSNRKWTEWPFVVSLRLCPSKTPLDILQCIKANWI